MAKRRGKRASLSVVSAPPRQRGREERDGQRLFLCLPNCRKIFMGEIAAAEDKRESVSGGDAASGENSQGRREIIPSIMELNIFSEGWKLSVLWRSGAVRSGRRSWPIYWLINS